jgi:hypothetical protein
VPVPEISGTEFSRVFSSKSSGPQGRFGCDARRFRSWLHNRTRIVPGSSGWLHRSELA